MGSSQRQGKRHSGTSESPGDAEMAGSLRERVYQIGIDGLMMVLERSKQAETLRALSPSVGPMMAELTRLAVKGTVTKFQAICAAVLGVTIFLPALRVIPILPMSLWGRSFLWQFVPDQSVNLSALAKAPKMLSSFCAVSAALWMKTCQSTMFSAAASAGGIVGVLVAIRSLKRYARNSKYPQ